MKKCKKLFICILSITLLSSTAYAKDPNLVGKESKEAQEILTNNNLSYSSDAVISEYKQKKIQGVEVYPLVDDYGNVLGYYEPHNALNPAPPLISRATYNINWTVSSGMYMYGDRQYTIKNGNKMYVNILQNKTGTSYLTFHNRSTGKSLRFTSTKTTSGWNATVTFANLTSTIYSFGIENASTQKITYTGYYNF